MPPGDPYREVKIGPGGHVEARLYGRDGARAGVVTVGGVGGGFDSPAAGLYGRLGRHLAEDGISLVWVRLRLPGELGEAALDVAAGVRFLASRGCGRVGVVGHSFGGAVAIRVGAALPEVALVIAISTQSYGTDRVTALAGRPLLLVHGADDEVLPPDCSIEVFRRAGEPKELRLLPGAGHVLGEVADEVYRIVHGFIAQHLVPSDPPRARA